MPLGPLSRRPVLILLACTSLLSAGCVACRLGPVPAGAPIADTAGQVSVLRSGLARVRVSTPIRRRFVFPLQPSATYPSPPARLELAYGEAETGEGMDLEVPPVRGPVLTSSEAILALVIHLPRTGLLHLTSMDRECSVTLSRVATDAVGGSFVCRALHEEMGTGVRVSASGTFDART